MRCLINVAKTFSLIYVEFLFDISIPNFGLNTKKLHLYASCRKQKSESLKVFGLESRSSASEIFVLTFTILNLKLTFAFTTRLTNSKNVDFGWFETLSSKSRQKGVDRQVAHLSICHVSLFDTQF